MMKRIKEDDRMTKITMKEIAEFAGVGKSTVSRYFNGGYVKEETRLRIEAVCREYHYQPNSVAKTLKARHSYQIGVITPSIDSRTSARVLTALDEQLRLSGYTPLLINTNHNEIRELSSLESFSRMNVEGIILLATQITPEHERILRKLRLPVIVLAQEMANVVTITLNDYEAGREVGQRIGQTHHQAVCLLGVSETDKAVGITRKQGILDGLQETGVSSIDFLETDFSFETTRQVVREYLKTHRPDCLICATDNLAMAAFKELHSAGLRIPQDVSLVGFGGYDVSEVLTPALTTVRFDYELEGRTAAELILELIAGNPVESVKIGYTLIEGESVIER
jgi:LacI family transcriptional regulator, sucrose operon repressor